MASFSFWNINGKSLEEEIASVCREHDVDLMILAECEFEIVGFLQCINVGLERKYGVTRSPWRNLTYVHRYPSECLELVSDMGGISIRALSPPGGIGINIVALHLGSKMFASDFEQAMMATRLRDAIEDAESRARHKRTIVVGDLNMNPFEEGVVSSESLHSVMDRRIAKMRSRKVAGEERMFFYNPMWGLMGCSGKRSPGTYFYRDSSSTCYFWNTFDQVLVRPDLLSRFEDSRVRIVNKIGEMSLLRANGRPNGEQFSDHLPIVFEVNLEGGECEQEEYVGSVAEGRNDSNACGGVEGAGEHSR